MRIVCPPTSHSADMDVLNPLLSTTQAAELLGVHKSSVKRWCNVDALSCSVTPGGHRRIAFRALLEFARRRDLPCRLLDFDPFELRLWNSLEQARSQDRFQELIALVYEWLADERKYLLALLLEMLVEMRFSLTSVFDRLLAPLMVQVGDAWNDCMIDLGDERCMTQIVRDSLVYLRFRLLKKPDMLSNELQPTAIVGCAPDEAHDLGAVMIHTLLEDAAWKVIYLGANVPAEELAFQQVKHRASLVCVSLGSRNQAPDVRRLLRMLSHRYQANYPYRLALGGGMLLRDSVDFGHLCLPFLEVQVFPDTSTFVPWMASFPEAPVKQRSKPRR